MTKLKEMILNFKDSGLDESEYTSKIINHIKNNHKEFSCDFLGHFKEFTLQDKQSYLYIHLESIIRKSLFFLKVLDREKAEEVLKDSKVFIETVKCSECGERYFLTIDTSKNLITLINLDSKTHKEINVTPCKNYSENYSFEITIPSKKIVFANHFPGLIDEKYIRDSRLDSKKGIKELTMLYASLNFGYVTVGNSMPSIGISNKEIIVGDSDEFKSNVKVKGNICTDLWAVQFMDYFKYQELLKNNNLNENEYNIDTIEIKIKSKKVKVTILNANDSLFEPLKFKCEEIDE